MLNVALPKGRLADKVYGLFEQMGYICENLFSDKRKLVLTDKQNDIRYFLVKPSDVAVYVERGAADIGVVGKDILLETKPDVYELLDLRLGKCKVAVASVKGFVEDRDAPLRVATKYSSITRQYYGSLGREIEVIHLGGSIELAPVLGLSDVIVDIVETGGTLKANNLYVLADITPVSARLIANKASYKFKTGSIDRIAKGLSEVIKND